MRVKALTWTGRRGQVRLTGALALCGIVTLGACSGSAHSTSAPPAAGPSVVLTLAQARTAFGHFLPAFRSAQRTHDPATELALVAGAEVPAVEHMPSQSLGPPVPPLASVRVIVPRLTSYPRWFIATGSAAVAAGSAGAGERFLLVLIQSRPGAAWQEATELYEIPGYPPGLPDLGTIAVDSHGYASVFSGSGRSLATPVGGLGAGFSNFYNAAISKPRGPLPPGYTSATVATERAAARQAPRYGWRVIDRLRPWGYPVYALRLAGGGALVIYATNETYGWQAIAAAATLTAPRSATGIGAAPDPFTLSQLHITSARVGLRIIYTIVDEHIAVDPAGGGTVADFLNGKTVAITRS